MKKWTNPRLAFAIVLAVSVVLIVFIVRWFAADRLPPLDQQRFDQARLAWETEPAEDYRITTEVTGRQPAKYTVEVRLGRRQVRVSRW